MEMNYFGDFTSIGTIFKKITEELMWYQVGSSLPYIFVGEEGGIGGKNGSGKHDIH